MAEIMDETMQDLHSGEPRLPLSDTETRVLELYDKIQELRLEIAIINAQTSEQPGNLGQTLDKDITSAQNALLGARARYRLRNDVVEAVMMANPILKAVHNGTEASPIERDLLPYVEERDEASISVAKLADDENKLREELNKVQVETIQICRENISLTAELFSLAELVKNKTAAHLDNPDAQRELAKLEDDVKSSRQRWKVMKGVASGIVVGSGVDWARDEELQDIVLDPEVET